MKGLRLLLTQLRLLPSQQYVLVAAVHDRCPCAAHTAHVRDKHKGGGQRCEEHRVGRYTNAARHVGESALHVGQAGQGRVDDATWGHAS